MLRRSQVPHEVSENKDLTALFTPLWFKDLRYESEIMCTNVCKKWANRPGVRAMVCQKR